MSPDTPGVASDDGAEDAIHICVEVVAAAGDEDVGQLTRQLIDEASAAGIGQVRPVRVSPLSSARKELEIDPISSLLITLTTSPEVVAQALQLLRAWLHRGRGHQLKVSIDGDEIVLLNATDDQQERLVDTWISRHSRR